MACSAPKLKEQQKAEVYLVGEQKGGVDLMSLLVQTRVLMPPGVMCLGKM